MNDFYIQLLKDTQIPVKKEGQMKFAYLKKCNTKFVIPNRPISKKN